MGREERTCAGTQSAAHLPGDEEQPLAVGCGLVGSTAVLGAQLGWADRLSPLPTEHGQARQEGLWVCQDPHPAAPGGAAAHAAGMLLLQYQKLSLQNEPASSEEPFGFPIVRGHDFQGRQLADGELLAGSREH